MRNEPATRTERFAVEVDEAAFAQAVMLIDQSGLPKPKFATLTDVLSDSRLIASPSQDRARINYAMSQELSRTVSEIEGVVSARVHLATPSEDRLSRRETDSSASVAIHYRPDFAAVEVVPQIKVLIANAVDGLDQENVSVALFPTSLDSSATPLAPNSDDYEFGNSPPKVPAAVTPAGVSSFGISPAIAAVLGGGLIVLLLTGQALVGGMRRSTKNTDAYAAKTRRGR